MHASNWRTCRWAVCILDRHAICIHDRLRALHMTVAGMLLQAVCRNEVLPSAGSDSPEREPGGAEDLTQAESGWDRLVEFPEKVFAGPADTHPPRSVAYVQVKSVHKRSPPTCRVKLSNALRAAQSPQPWFVVLVTAPTPKYPPRIYAVHFWEELIRRTLESVRRAENEKHPLHKRGAMQEIG